MSSKFLNLSTDNTLGGSTPSDNKAVSEKAIKEYVDNKVPVIEEGGKLGQVFVKKSDTNYDTEWQSADDLRMFNKDAFTVVGSPTITDDGIFTSTSANGNNYIKIDNIISSDNLKLEFDFDIKNGNYEGYFIGGSSSTAEGICYIGAWGCSSGPFSASNLGGYNYISDGHSYNIYLKWNANGTNELGIKRDNEPYYTSNSTWSGSLPSTFIIGYRYNDNGNAVVNLKTINITVDNQVVFNGSTTLSNRLADKVDKLEIQSTSGTYTKVTINSDGLVSSGSMLSASDIPPLTLSKISDITASPSEVNILDGATLTTTELNYVDGVTSSIQTQFNNITEKIPVQATTSNQLADKNFVNSSIATNTANFIGTFNSLAELEAYTGTVTNNDYAFVVGTDSDGNTVYNRYKYNDIAFNRDAFTVIGNPTITDDGIASGFSANQGLTTSNITSAQFQGKSWTIEGCAYYQVGIAQNFLLSLNTWSAYFGVIYRANSISLAILTGTSEEHSSEGIKIELTNPFTEDTYCNFKVEYNHSTGVYTLSIGKLGEGYTQTGSWTATTSNTQLYDINTSPTLTFRIGFSSSNSYFDGEIDLKQFSVIVDGVKVITGGGGWLYEYTLNNSSFTAAQWAAINSNATTTNIAQITTNQNAIGTLSSLTTTAKTNLVSAVNEVNSGVADVKSDIAGGSIGQVFVKKSNEDYDVEWQSADNLRMYNKDAFTVVGSPTITDDGVASGFSSSSYLQIPDLHLETANNWKIELELIAGDTSEEFGGILSQFTGSSFSLVESTPIGYFTLGLSSNGTSWDILNPSGFAITANTGDRLRFDISFTGTKYSFIVDNLTTGVTGVLHEVTSSNKIYSSPTQLGILRTSSYICHQLIDLKQFSITVDGVEVFNGSIPLAERLGQKQNTLVSGTNIKTVNNNSLLGSGNINIDSLPSQSGQSGKFLTTNGTSASWATIPTPTYNSTNERITW